MRASKMTDGWVKLWRKSVDTGMIKNHNVWIFWTYCLMKANHKKDYKQVVGFQEVVLQPGQFIFGLNVASEETGLSIQNIRTCLTFLKKFKNLTIKPTNKFSIISIVNWDSYQQQETQTNNQSNKHVTSSQQASNNKQEQKNKRTSKLSFKKDNSSSKEFEDVKNSRCPHKKIRDLYNSTLGSVLPFCRSTNQTFDKMLKARWREDKNRQNIEWWEWYFKYIAESDFLMGRTDNPFTASFEWVIRPTNMSKIINGNYHNTKKVESLEDYAKRRGLV